MEYAKAKAAKTLRSLGLLMPNLRGPSQSKRRLFYNVIMSIILYGVLVWGPEYLASSVKQRPLKRVQRRAALRVVCAYRTASLDAAVLLAGFPPLFLVISARIKIYHRIEEVKKNDTLTVKAAREIRNQEYSLMREGWREYLMRPNLAGVRTLGAIQPQIGGLIEDTGI